MKKAKGSSLGMVSLKMSAIDHKAILAKAKVGAEGNLSAWLRYTGKNYVLKKGEKVPLDPKARKASRADFY